MHLKTQIASATNNYVSEVIIEAGRPRTSPSAFPPAETHAIAV